MDVSRAAEQHVEGVVEILFGGFQMPGIVVLLAGLVFLLDRDDQGINCVRLGLKLFLNFGRNRLLFRSLSFCSGKRGSGCAHRGRRGSALFLRGVFAGRQCQHQQHHNWQPC